MEERESPAIKAGKPSCATKPEVKTLTEWAKLKNTSDWDLAGVRCESFFNTINAECTEAQYDAALAKFRGTRVGYQVLSGKNGGDK
jgi:hypothetical protein